MSMHMYDNEGKRLQEENKLKTFFYDSPQTSCLAPPLCPFFLCKSRVCLSPPVTFN